MDTILDRIAEYAGERVAAAKKEVSPEAMHARALAAYERDEERRGSFPFEKALSGTETGFICECKKASPSKGLIAPEFPCLAIAKEYENAGAAAISVLTEPKWFLGRNQYLQEIAAAVRIPCLRKDFTVDPYMIDEAKVLGASAVLLICALLPEETLAAYIAYCDQLGLSALVEAHDEEEVDTAVRAGARVIGVNNRNLRDFSVDIRNSIRLRERAPRDRIFVAESGIRTASEVEELRKNGVNGILIGETLMRAPDKKAALDMLRGGYKVKWKLCGLRRMEDTEAANRVKPDFAGFIFDPSRRRYIPPEEAEKLRQALDPEILSAGVFVNAGIGKILDDTDTCRVDLIQLHGQEDNAYIAALRAAITERERQREGPRQDRPGKKISIMKAFRICSEADLQAAASSEADYVLLDNGIGGTGKAFDWNLLKGFQRPFVLAGGISAENVKEAVRTARPMAVDVSSSLETDGVKDPEKIRQFAKAIEELRKGK